MGNFVSVLKCAARYWVADNASTVGAALAFYCAFSIAPLLVIVVTLLGWITGPDAASTFIADQLAALFGSSSAHTIVNAMRSARQTSGTVAAIISVVTLVIGATTVFSALETVLNTIWGSTAMVRSGVMGWVRSRLLSFGFVIALGFLLLVSLTLSTVLAAVQAHLSASYQPLVAGAQLVDFVFSVALSTGLFALVYRYMPAARLPWRRVIGGALFSALLFYAGRWAIGIYLARSAQPSSFGAAASFATLLLWLYYSAQIFLFGAEFTSCLGALRKDETRQPIGSEVPKTHVCLQATHVQTPKD